MSRRNRWDDTGKAGHRGPVNLAGLVQHHGFALLPRPFLWLAVGRDARSWGISIGGAEALGADGLRAPSELLVDSRWMADRESLADVALIAQSALRKVSLDRGWPIP